MAVSWTALHPSWITCYLLGIQGATLHQEGERSPAMINGLEICLQNEGEEGGKGW